MKFFFNNNNKSSKSKPRRSNKYSNTDTNLESRVVLSAITDLEPNNTPSLADNLGTFSGNFHSETIYGHIGNNGDTQDWYQFTLAKSYNAEVVLNAFNQDLDLRLYNSSEQEIANSRNAGTTGELISRELAAGTYFIKAERYGSSVSSYSLRLNLNPSVVTPPGDAYESNNTSSTAYNLGNVGNGLNRTLYGNVGFNGDKNDYFKFTVEPGKIVNGTLTLSGMSEDANIFIAGPNTNKYSDKTGSQSESITLTNLTEGTYTVLITSWLTAKTNYSFSVNLTPTITTPPADIYESNNTESTAYNLGNVGTGINRTLNGNIGYNGDTADYYKFTVEAGKTVNGSVTLSGLTADVDLYLRGPGLDAKSDKSGTQSESILFSNLAAGTYFIKVVPYYSAKTAYLLEIKLTPNVVTPPADIYESNNTETTAYNLGNVGTGINRTLNGNIGYNGDTADYYKFTVEAGKIVNGTISVSTSQSMTSLRIYGYGSSVDIIRIVPSGSNETVTLSDLNPGTYYILVSPALGLKTDYALSVRLNPIAQINPDPNGANNTTAQAVNMGNVGPSSLGYSKSEIIGTAGDTADYYKFNVNANYESNFTVTYTVTQGSIGNLFVKLVDANGTAITLAESLNSGGTTTKSFTLPSINSRIPAGTYYVVFSSSASANLKYNFSIGATAFSKPIDDPYGKNDTKDQAISLGAIPNTTSSSLYATRSERLNPLGAPADSVDYFKFTHDNRYITRFKFTLTITVTSGNPNDLIASFESVAIPGTYSRKVNGNVITITGTGTGNTRLQGTDPNYLKFTSTKLIEYNFIFNASKY